MSIEALAWEVTRDARARLEPISEALHLLAPMADRYRIPIERVGAHLAAATRLGFDVAPATFYTARAIRNGTMAEAMWLEAVGACDGLRLWIGVSRIRNATRDSDASISEFVRAVRQLAVDTGHLPIV